MKVLIVDDNIIQLQFTKSVLEKHGHEVITSTTAWVSNIVSAEKPSIVLMDLNIGAVNGSQAIKSLKGRKFSDDVLYYLHSSDDLEKIKKEVLECGADGYVPKCIKESEFIKDFNEIIKNVEPR